MFSSNSMKALPVLSQNLISNVIPVSTDILVTNVTNYQPLNSIYSNNSFSKSNISLLLTEQNYEYKNISPAPTLLANNSILRPLIYDNIKKSLAMNNNISNYQYRRQRHYSHENINISNIFNYNANNEIKNDSNLGLVTNQVDYGTQKLFKKKLSKIPHPNFPKRRQNANLFSNYSRQFNNNYNTQFYLNQGNTLDYSTINTNSDINILPNNTIESSLNTISYDTVTSSFMEMEPDIDLKLSEYEILNQIGQGSEGAIYVVRWKKNNKNYAMKKCNILLESAWKKKKNDSIELRRFIESTGCDGVIKIYGNFCKTSNIGFYEFYELMELAEKDWEKEIIRRRDLQQFYSEYELMDIFRHLIRTFSLLQSNSITHRDVKPQNIMLVNGKFKICDFGNARVLKGNGIIIQKIRGSELFMSPILFKGYHSGKNQIRHNAFKSDVYSLGICFLFAASLSFDGPNIIREIYDNKVIDKVLNKYLAKKYSQNLINLISSMLQVDENKRPDFNLLETMIL